jgi:hypothetical protein
MIYSYVILSTLRLAHVKYLRVDAVHHSLVVQVVVVQVVLAHARLSSVDKSTLLSHVHRVLGRLNLGVVGAARQAGVHVAGSNQPLSTRHVLLIAHHVLRELGVQETLLRHSLHIVIMII